MGDLRTRRVLFGGRVATAVVLSLVLAFALLIALPSSAIAAGNILFWSQKTIPPDTFISGYGGEWGGYIWCFGGFRSNVGPQSALTDVYMYNPSPYDTGGPGGTWYTMPVGSPPSVDPVYATSGGGFAQYGSKVYVFGGRTSTSTPPNNVIWSYNLANGMTTFEGALNAPRGGCGVAIVGHYAYIVGGSYSGNMLNTIEVVDLSATPGTLVGQPLSITLTDAVTRPVVFSDATSVYVFGGQVMSTPTPYGTCSPQALRFDPGATPPSSATWMTNPTAMPYPRQGHHQKATASGYVYITGDALNNDVLEYNMNTDVWSLIGSQPLPLARSLAVADSAGTTIYDVNGLDKIGNILYQKTQAAQVVPATAVGAPISVPSAGTSVTASAGGTNVTASFDALTNPGSALLNVSTMPTSSLPAGAGIGFRIQGQVYDIATTADGWGTVTITLPYTGARVPVIRHWTGSSWDKITVEWPTSLYPTSPYAVDPWAATAPPNYPTHTPANGKIISWGGGTVTFQTTSLSPFAIELPASSAPMPTTSTPASSGWSLALSAFALLGMAAFAQKRLRVH